MAMWEFNNSDASDVRQEITQADQFNNDDVALPEALVREAVQNSTDARRSDAVGAVKVRFSIKELSIDEKTEYLQMTDGLVPHLEASGFETAFLEEPLRILTIEDFNTQGLTGSISELDGNDNFELFWRSMGQSAKSGSHGGRWGLGKLTYALSSKARTFFGLTVRADEEHSLLMGQAVLRNHKIDTNRFKPHGFWFKERGGSENIQLPEDNTDVVTKFARLTGVTRSNQSGLSVIIPFLRDAITEENIIASLMTNYFFPILSGSLEAEVGDRIISADTFIALAEEFEARLPSTLPLRFVKSISEKLGDAPDFTVEDVSTGTKITQDSFDAGALEKLRSKYRDFETVHVKVPITLTRKDGTETASYLETFLEPLREKEAPYALIARNSILLKAEQKYFGARQAHAALVATDDVITEFLGDAENPAHTQWTLNAEKAHRNWNKVVENIKIVRSLLADLHSVIAEQEEEKDENILLDFFSIVEKAKKKAGKKPKSPKPDPDIEPSPRALLIRKSGTGFELKNGPATADWQLPRSIRIRLAYDLLGANPFKSHSRFDFDLKFPDTITWEADGGKFTPADKNIAIFMVDSEEFSLRLDGFDVNRDLIVDARAV